jgi:geranylgeranyl pyrophosphate synthase
MQTASTLPNNTNTASRLNRSEKKILAKITDMTSKRETQDVDPRTFISDARSFVKSLLEYEFLGDNPIHETVRYVLGGDSKYIRSGMALMLADSLKVRPETIAPLLVSIEMSHAASLLFDDLPAQDNAETRRGQPTAHKKFPEYTAQLAGIAMLNRSIGVLTELSTHFNSEKVTKIISYVTDKVGGDLTLGQCKDLANIADDEDEILDIYALKTSTLIEAALVPIMILSGRSSDEIKHISNFAHHAGIVYQLQDDILDATADPTVLGKAIGQDEGKINIVSFLII